MQRYIASFNPQAWVNDYAIDVDPEGETRWDCTEAFGSLPESYRTRLISEMEEEWEALDGNDLLQSDPQAPRWVQEWRGPFSIFVHQAGMRTDLMYVRISTAHRRDDLPAINFVEVLSDMPSPNLLEEGDMVFEVDHDGSQEVFPADLFEDE